MRPRFCVSIAVLVCALLVPAAGAQAAKTQLSLRACHTGDAPTDRTATFYARMYAVKHTKRMAMRFTLINRAAGRASLVSSPGLAQWRRSRPGVKRFGYAQSVEGLEQGGVYAMRVTFRWIGRAGEVIRTVRRSSSSCRQQGPLPNLSVTQISARAGQASGTAVYDVDVTNSGQGSAQNVRLNLFVDGIAADADRIDSLAAGQTVTVHFTAPSCKHWLRAVVDPANKIAETNEDDNTFRVRCPPIG